MGLTVLIVLFGIGALMYYLMKKSMNRKVTKLFFVGYVAILCIAFSVYEFGLSKKIKIIEQSNSVDAEKEVERFYDAVYEGRTEDIDPSYVFKKEEVDYPYNQLTISMYSSEDDGFGVPIIVERKEINDDNIEVIYYRTKPSAYEMELTKELKPIQMTWSNDALILGIPERQEFNFNLFKKEFPISQFFGSEVEERYEIDPTYSIGDEAIYLRVPRDLEVIEGTDEVYIDFVGEE